MHPVRILAVVGLVAPIWLARAGENPPTAPPPAQALPPIEPLYPQDHQAVPHLSHRRISSPESGWTKGGEHTGTTHVQARLPKGPIAEIRFEGKEAGFAADKIRPWLLSRVGQPFDAQKIDADVISLMQTGRFSQVETHYDVASPGSKKHVLIFSVKEMPTYKHVEFRGLGAIGRNEVEEVTGLKVGAPADYMRARNAIHRIDRLYGANGFHAVRARLIEGGEPGDDSVVIEVTEGLRSSIGKVLIEGNRRIGTEALSKVLQLHPGEPYSLAIGEADRHRLLARYSEIGCLDAEISIEARPTSRKDVVDVVFRIREGNPYVLGNLRVGPKQDRVLRRVEAQKVGPAKDPGKE